jgi:hypothetical protein
MFLPRICVGRQGDVDLIDVAAKIFNSHLAERAGNLAL